MKRLISLMAVAACGLAQVVTAQYDNERSGATLMESILTPANVNAKQFGKLFSIPLDGVVYAQPLYLPRVDIPGKGRHNVVFIATEHDSVYAFDADRTGEPLWSVSFIHPAKGVVPLTPGDVHCSLIEPEIGITSTPVIDRETSTLYVLARTKENSRFVQRLHALDIHSGRERDRSPVTIRASIQGVPFDPVLENQRAALLLTHGRVFIAWCGSCDSGDYHGWVMAYDAHTLTLEGVLNTSPGSLLSGIWQSDAGPAADAAGNVYLITGNGNFDPRRGNFGNSVLKLKLENRRLRVADYFTPFNQAALDDMDQDLGSQGPVLIDSHSLIFGSKGRGAYLIDRDRMGKFHPNNDDHATQTIDELRSCFGAPARWLSHVYFWCSNDVLREYILRDGKLAPGPRGNLKIAFPGAIPSVSADHSQNGIVWVIDAPDFRQKRPSVLRAFDAGELTHELYSSSANPADQAGPGIRFAIPTVANGKVYVATAGEVDVYGLRQ